MTCIVGIQHADGVSIGGDSAGSNGWHISIRGDQKVFTRGPYVMGFTTSFRMGQLLRYRLDVGAPDTWDVDRFMATTFMDAVRECLKVGGFATVKDGAEVGGQFLVGVGRRLYVIDADYQIGLPQDGYAAVGSGYMAALGALHATDGQPVDDRITAALKAAAHTTVGVQPPFVIERTQA